MSFIYYFYFRFAIIWAKNKKNMHFNIPETTSRSETPIRVGDALKDVASKPTSGRSRNSILKTPSLRDHGESYVLERV